MDEGWKQFWHQLWEVLSNYIWPPVQAVFLAIFWFLYSTFYHVGGGWGVFIGGFVMLIIGKKLSGSYSPGSGQVDSSGHVTIYRTGFYQKPWIQGRFFIYLGKSFSIFGYSLIGYLLYVLFRTQFSVR